MNKNIAIRIEGLGKRYQLGHTVDLSRTFREVLIDLPKRVAAGARQSIPFIKKNGSLHHSEENDRVTDSSPDTFWALRDVNLEIGQGEVVGIIGRNGAGKSTLLKILSRVTTPTTGQVEIRGRVGSLLEVGTGFHPELTGRENIFLNGAILGMRKYEIDRRFDEIVAFAEVDKFLDTPIKRYSSGMQVRLAFSVAAHLEPEILIVDEVLAVGDVQFQKKCLGKMSDVAKQGRTVLFVSHNMTAIHLLCTRAVLLSSGQVAQDAVVDKVISSYLDGIKGTVNSNRRYDTSIIQSAEVRIQGNQPEKELIWQANKTLAFTLFFQFTQKVQCPFLDLSFYRMDGLKLFSLIHIHNHDNRQIQEQWNFDFEVDQIRFGSQEIFFDLGLKFHEYEEYAVVWQRFADIIVYSDEFYTRFSKDSLVLPDVQVAIS